MGGRGFQMGREPGEEPAKPGEGLTRSKSVVDPGEGPPSAGGAAPKGGDSAGGRAAEGEDDRELVRRAQGGDEPAFRRLVERHGERARGLALRILRSPSDAEEVAQDAFVRAWRALPRFRAEAAFSSWLYRIVVRQALDRAAVLKGRRTREADIEDAGELPAESAGLVGEASERAQRLERLIGTLPEVQRTVVTLYYYQDRSVEDVARTLGMPQNTVKTHLSRARAALRAAWTSEPGGEDPS